MAICSSKAATAWSRPRRNIKTSFSNTNGRPSARTNGTAAFTSATPPSPKGRPWPKRYQANLLKGKEGDVGGIEGASSKGLLKDREWNKFKLTVNGSKISLQINGKDAWKGDGLEDLEAGFIAVQAEVPGGGQHYFRNIFITEL